MGGSLYVELRAEFDKGIEAALDKKNKFALLAGGAATTEKQSRWLSQRCSVCLHTFRLGDVVMIDVDGSVRHDMDLLPCARVQATDQPVPASDQVESFFAGIDSVWPTPPEVIHLAPTHILVARPKGAFRRRKCVVCGHTLRPHDSVLICPCDPARPRCQAAVHRDVLHGLPCWEAWNPAANDQTYCPITGRSFS